MPQMPGMSTPAGWCFSDGHWLAYSSNESGRLVVYVQAFPGPGGKYKISRDGGFMPLWSRDGRKLFYQVPWWLRRGQIFEVDVEIGDSFSASKPKHLLEQPPGYLGDQAIRIWDIAPDGQRFLVTKMDDKKRQPVTEMVLVLNWFEELKRLVPTGKQ
jgi:eukaryotic-like serine/threonine-protein kinase